ncbi:hypothetical protein BGZ63DRAFT_406496 [Mariannaea sp. PMI_226]|nr:hypothetical protein BGZ63DRAFT_406496 [Mariannaea sp. PMI_226]
MSVAVQHHGRSRAESLQRMLDLEKKMMLQRTQSLTTHSFTSSVHEIPVLQPQPRRFELVPKDGKKAPPPPVRIYDRMSATTPVIGGSNSATDSNAAIPIRLLAHGHSRTNSAPVGGTMEKANTKQVAFAIPPDDEDRRKPGRQPTSLEAHDRRKQERKDTKEEKREERRGREQNVVAREKPRGRRLSKAPPVSGRNLASQGHGSMDPMSPSKDKRSSSILGISISRRDTNDSRNEPAERSRRGRSGSLSSAVRNSFEIRRGSYDQTTASGFLGGVKLEKKKQDFTQQVIDDQTQTTSRVHPALRKSFLGHGSFTPLKTATTQSALEKEPETQQRTYPPISIQTSGAVTQPGASLNTPIRRDSAGSANIYLWSARANKKIIVQSDECAVGDEVDDDETEQRPTGVALTDTPPTSDMPTTTVRRRGVQVKNNPRPLSTSTLSIDSLRDFSQDNVEGVKPLSIAKSSKPTTPESTELASLEPQSEESSVSELEDKTSSQLVAAKTRPKRESIASVTSNPPAPPRKSSKRGSVVVSSHSSTTTETSKDSQSRSSKESLGTEAKPPAVTKLMTARRNATPPSIRYETTLPGVRPTPYPGNSPTLTSGSRWTSKDTTISAHGRGESPSGSSNPYSASISPVSSTGSFFKGRVSPAVPSSPLKNEATVIAPVPPHMDVQPMQKQVNSKPVSSRNQPHQPSVTEHLTPKRNSATGNRGLVTSSSNDSLYSDALQSTSASGTPDSTPPQSDSGFPLRNMNSKHQPVQYSPYWSKNNSPDPSGDRFQLSDSPLSSDSDMDPVEAAARRVMEAFSHANLQSPTTSRKGSDSSEESNLSSVPDIQSHHPRLRHREKSKGRLRTSQTQQGAKLSQSNSGSGVKPSRSTPNMDARSSQNLHKRAAAVAPSPAATAPPHVVPDVPRNESSRPNPQRGDRVGKMFVVCCECRRYHDIPVKLYKTMLNPGGVLTSEETKGFEDRVCMTVKCSWCDHQMSTKCCPGVSGILDIQGRAH